MLTACTEEIIQIAPWPEAVSDGRTRIVLVEGPQSSAVIADGACVVQTDMPREYPASAGGSDLPGFEHLGREVYGCLRGFVPLAHRVPERAWFDRAIQFRIGESASCAARDGFTAYGCYDLVTHTANVLVQHIGPDSRCPHATPFPEGYTSSCWTQFHRVLGHEIGHAIYGRFH